MITPNKVVTLENSALGLVTVILEQGPKPIKVLELYYNTSRKFESIDQFILAIDLLYALGRININFQSGTLSYVN